MALARIISRSQLCSRELAIDLLARGYTVEIVSPDAIPGNIADLELRVESGPDNLLTANVETHNGVRTASLDFVHHLKSPMGNFIRRPPEPTEAVCRPEISGALAGYSISDHSRQPVSVHAELPAVDPPSLPESTDSVPGNSRPAEKTIPLIVAPLVAAPDQLQAMPEEPPKYAQPVQAIRPVVTVAMHKSAPQLKKKQVRQRSEGWFGRTAVTFAGVVLVALLLGFGVRHEATSSPSVVAASDSNPFGIDERSLAGSALAVLAAPPTTSAAPTPPKQLAPIPSKSDSRNTKQGSTRASKKRELIAKATKHHHETPGGSNGDLVAPNTIVYFGHAAPTSAAVKKASRQGSHSPKPGDGVVAASKAPELSAKPASNGAQPK